MSSSDVRSILNLPQSGPSNSVQSRKASSFKRPDGISRELYALIGDNAPSLVDAQASVAAVKYRDRPKIKTTHSKWEWKTFTPLARVDSNPVQLGHWVRVSDEDPEATVKYFGSFNANGPSIMEYSQYEYDQHLADPDWTPHETAYLFDLLREYDLRFIVAADRYAYQGPTGVRRRSVEDMKDRYYTICRKLARTRTASDAQSQQQLIQSHSFDKAREIKRKQYASELFHLTAAEIAEEEALYVEIKRLEQTERRYRADRDVLMRSVLGLDSGLVNTDSANIDSVLGMTKKRKRPEDELPPTPVVPKETAAFDAARCIVRAPQPTAPNSSHLAAKHPIHQPACLRSTKLPVPKSTYVVRVTEVLTELGVNSHKLVMPTRSNIEEFDGLLNAVSALVDMKRQVDRVSQEVRLLRAQKEGYIPPPADPRKARSESVTSTDTSTTRRR
ncbi:hypothetical protein DB88DRAFT_494255 [Papiliotrema laurentii]|uniref:SWR1-complex protein 4 n=1 Tax=Papiliotrema laurentii TaxID=5418 RepID=A0AAD9CWF4_PAPLA|nr:hypothetical protein DB88DRAFT_494255 [Papiliotrema laurentii]